MLQLLQLPGGLVAALLAALVPGPACVAAAPSVNVAMKAAFPSPPYLLELLSVNPQWCSLHEPRLTQFLNRECAAQENATAYFPILDRIADGSFAKAETERDLYEKFLDVLRHDGYMTPESLSTFKLALSMRSAAPRIEAHYQYYATAVEASISDPGEHCAQWVLLGGKQYCTPSLSNAEGTVAGDAYVWGNLLRLRILTWV